MSDPESMAVDEDGIATDAAGAAEDGRPRAAPRKRRRIVISCTECHRRKQKCDRKMPCTNCTQRGKESQCRYETGMPLAGPRKGSVRAGREDAADSKLDSIPMKAADFGYSHTGGGTLGFLSKIEGAGIPLASVAAEAQEADHFGVRERYKSLIRQLPARSYLEKLIDLYMHDFNWQYYGLDEPVFREYLDRWFSLPFNILSTMGPQGIDPTLRAFPALIFQILATALLGISDEEDEEYAALKYAGSMTFEDLALDYSETGVALLSLLGKRQMTMTTVLAGWVRASFLKYTGQVTEAWHQIGTAIRDAQEIGLHRDSFDFQPAPGDTTENTLFNLWDGQCRRRTWMTLVGWDLHTGAVLGRPTSVDFRTLDRSLPVDAPIAQNRRTTPIFPRGENDPPTPLTRAIWAYETMKPLRDIMDLEKEGPFPKDFSKVEKIHQELLELQERTPPPFRLENPDTRFDHLPECWWIPFVRPTLSQIISFDFMALHRPYIFTRAGSRYEALKASLEMLEGQRLHFAQLKPQQYRTFSLFFGTFDAIVMMASIYILFPKEHPDLLGIALQHFQWAVERFETMATKNRLAQAALGVLNAIYIRLKKAVGNGFLDKNCPGSFTAENPASSNDNGRGSIASGSATQTPASDTMSSHRASAASVSGSSIPLSDSGTSLTSPSATEATPAPNPAGTTGLFDSVDWSFPNNFDFSAMPPMYPMGDVAYNDLTGVREGGYGSGANSNTWPASALPNGSVSLASANNGLDGNAPWQFGGDFGNDTIWSLLNQFPPY